MPSNVFTCISLGDHVDELGGQVVLVWFQLSGSVTDWQRNRDRNSKFVKCPL